MFAAAAVLHDCGVAITFALSCSRHARIKQGQQPEHDGCALYGTCSAAAAAASTLHSCFGTEPSTSPHLTIPLTCHTLHTHLPASHLHVSLHPSYHLTPPCSTHLPNTTRATNPRLGDHTTDKATAKLLGAALGSSDIEMGSGAAIGASYTPSWVARSERLKTDMAVLKERITKLKE